MKWKVNALKILNAIKILKAKFLSLSESLCSSVKVYTDSQRFLTACFRRTFLTDVSLLLVLQADADLRYTPQHKPLLLQLPNMKTIKITVCFSSPVFKTVLDICRQLSQSDSEPQFTLWKNQNEDPPALLWFQTSGDQKNSLCSNLQMIRARRRRRKTRTLLRKTSLTSGIQPTMGQEGPVQNQWNYSV